MFIKKYLEKENVSDLLKFWMQAENFSRNLLLNNTNDLESFYNQSQNDAMIIYDK